MNRIILAAVLLCSAAAGLQAQATFDAQSSSVELFTSAAATQTFTHTTGAGTNRLLLVSVHLNITDQVGATVTDVEYNNVDLTRLNAIGDASADTHTEVWYMLNPPAGTFNVDVGVGGLGAGDTVYFAPEEKHWHGAAPDAYMVHLAINPANASDGGTAWQEPVTDEEYAVGSA